MVRVGTHYLEPRRIGYFVAEGVVLWAVFVAVALGVSHLYPGAEATARPWVRDGIVAVAALQLGLYLLDLHDLRTALGDAMVGHRVHRAVGMSVILVGIALGVGWAAGRAPALVAGVGAVCVTTLSLRAALPALGQRLSLRTRLFLVGDGRAARMLVREIQKDGGAEVVGFGGPRTSRIAERARVAGATTVVVAADDREALPAEELLACRAAGMDVIDAATVAARVLHRLPVELVRPADLIYQDGFARPLSLLVMRRALSVTATLVLLALTWPVILLVSILVKLDSRGPVLYKQQRVGKNGQLFWMHKFRTMRTDAEAGGVKWAQKDDPRVTRLGKHLRRFRIDELPQLWNVLKGDMELVGPRPEREEFVAQLRRKIPFYDLRHCVPPGITGYAQVLYPYASSIEETKEKLQYDLYYVRHLSVWLDLYVLAVTAKVILFGRGAR